MNSPRIGRHIAKALSKSLQSQPTVPLAFFAIAQKTKQIRVS